jgi:TonB-dependent receptor
MRSLLVFLLLTFIYSVSFAQNGKISGKVINANSGQALASATLILIEKSKTIVADQNGAFSFTKLATGTYSVKCSYIGYNQKIVEEIIVKEGENNVITISLEEKSNKADEVVIVSKTRAKVESVASLLIAQKNSASVSDGISAESIKKTPDRSTSDVMKRVSGASIQDDRFAIIRGLNDRYNAAFINGAPLPSTESDRKAFAFDIFPSAILDNLVIYKTATPDKPGDFAGGIIEITTKGTVPKNFTSVAIGASFNTLITGKTKFRSENSGKKDFIGIDDGTRGLPNGIPSTEILGNTNNITTAERANLAKLFGNYKWGIKAANTAPNLNFQLSNGYNIQKNDREFISTLFSINYSKNVNFNEGERNTYDFDPAQNALLYQRKKYTDSIYNEETILALLGNVSIKINNNNNISWKNNFSINTDNKLIKRIGEPDADGDPGVIKRDIVNWFTSNQIFSSQLAGDHLVGKYKTKINWLANYSNVKRDIPNLSRLSYFGTPPDISAFFPSGEPNQLFGSGTMVFINSTESIKSFKADVTQPYKFLKNSQNFVKAGAGYQIRNRDFSTRILGLAKYDLGIAFDNTLPSLPENEIFLPENLGVTKNGLGGFLLAEGSIDNSNYQAISTLSHVYLMNDQRFFKKFRLIYGARFETFKQELNTFGNRNTPLVKIDTTINDFLPSANFIYSLNSKMNFRLSFSQTVNRPEFRELAPFLFYEYTTENTFGGLQDLKRAKIKNYDFRYEFYPGKAQLFSVSAFYKDFKDPIEIIFIPGTSNQASYSNTTSAKAYGVEAEFRTLLSTLFGVKKEGALLSKFTLSANAALIKSSIILDKLFSIDPARLVTDRALQGQSPYLINGSFSFNDDKLGLSATISVNRVGDRIYIAGIKDENADIYEKARTVVDMQVTKFLLKNKLELKLTARDLLAQDIVFYSDFDLSKNFTDSDKLFSSFKAPKVISFSATYKF